MGKYLNPSFLIIGGVKCATSSFYRYLNEHPQILPCKSKEPGLFASRAWYKVLLRYPAYRKQFPLTADVTGRVEAEWLDLAPGGEMVASTFSKQREAGQTYITGEATAATWLGADPRLVRWLLPDAKLIMLVRNPSQRYLSHFNMYRRFHAEGRPGYDFGNLEAFIEKEIDLHQSGQRTRVLEHGLYARYLPTWERAFGADALHLLQASELREPESAARALDRALKFLSLPGFDFGDKIAKQYNLAPAKPAAANAERLLDAFYAPGNEAFESRYNITLDDA